MSASIQPFDIKERAIIVDVLRGFALVGVLIANFTSFSDQQHISEKPASFSPAFDTMLWNINAVFFEWKFMTLFSILFGYGFGLLIKSVERQNIHPNAFFLRRMGWLFVLGMIHTAFWLYDVLHLYAVCGVLLLAFRRAKDKTILVASLAGMFVLPFCVTYFFRDQPDVFTEADRQTLYDRCKYGNLMQVLGANLSAYYKMFILSAADVHDVLETTGRFLLGYYFLRLDLFEGIDRKRYLFRKGLLYFLLPALAYLLLKGLDVFDQVEVQSIYWEPLIKIGIVSTTLVYSCLVVLAFLSNVGKKLISVLQCLGKMTLTNYLMVSVANVLLLYGIGWGKMGELPLHIIWFAALAWLIVEIVFSVYWLKYFRYGPMEWIWRQLTYRKWLPLRK
jgi:uncharacterized protein